jgi:hypothetical protein
LGTISAFAYRLRETKKTLCRENRVLAIEKLKSHKSPDIVQIPAELIKAGGRTISSEIHKFIISIWNKEELPEKWKESIIVPIYKKGDKTECNNYRGISVLLSFDQYLVICDFSAFQ